MGFGDVARHGHWPAYSASEAVSIVAVVDQSPERRALAAGLSPLVSTFETVEELSSSASIDLAYICTPPALHALDSGWHVCEKPVLLDWAVFEIARSKAAEAGRSIIPVHNWKYAPSRLRGGRPGSSEPAAQCGDRRGRHSEGGPVRLSIVPSSDPYRAIAHTACRQHSPEIVMGESATLAPEEQAQPASRA